jgi:hypothetical protein
MPDFDTNMPDFDTNEDPLRLSDSGKDEPFELPKLRPRFMRRARTLAYGQCFGSRRQPADRLQPRFATARWRTARRSCPSARTIGLLAAVPTRRRRLWTKCHGRAPGSPS